MQEGLNTRPSRTDSLRWSIGAYLLASGQISQSGRLLVDDTVLFWISQYREDYVILEIIRLRSTYLGLSESFSARMSTDQIKSQTISRMFLLPNLFSGRIEPLISIVTISNGSFARIGCSGCLFSGLDLVLWQISHALTRSITWV